MQSHEELRSIEIMAQKDGIDARGETGSMNHFGIKDHFKIADTLKFSKDSIVLFTLLTLLYTGR